MADELMTGTTGGSHAFDLEAVRRALAKFNEPRITKVGLRRGEFDLIAQRRRWRTG